MCVRIVFLGNDWVSRVEFEFALDKHRMGTDWKSRVRDKEDLRVTAYHEAGHTLVAYYTNDCDPIHKVTIVAKGMSGGHTAFLPEKERVPESKRRLYANMDCSMGGRAAEELVFGEDQVKKRYQDTIVLNFHEEGKNHFNLLELQSVPFNIANWLFR